MGFTRLSSRSRTRAAEPPTSSGVSPTCPPPRSRTRPVRAYVALTKPRIIELLLVTTLPTMVVADRGIPSVWLMAATVIGGTLAAGGANAINMYADRDIDRLMERTKNRPLVTGEVAPGRALAFAIALEVLAFAWLWGFVNLLSAVLAVSATAFYVFVYTLWLKRTSTRNIIIGGAAGAVPVLVGWSAVTNGLGWAPLVLFGLIFYWTPPHFWALAIRYRDDYRAANVPMLPAVASTRTTAVRIIGYTVVLWGLSVLFSAVGEMGLVYTVSAVVLGAVFLLFAVQVLRTQATAAAMRLFSYSITYITLLFGAMAIDQVVRTGV
ncbi:heme o synthase [Candidatus Poriferisocius sp.]|uniref:heme o synthase n=1 Tax=Candidatus Poriferisocius sp. TaxID=3101276 RepID=UPI003B01C934